MLSVILNTFIYWDTKTISLHLNYAKNISCKYYSELDLTKHSDSIEDLVTF